MARGLMFKIESNVLISHVALVAADGSARDFPWSPPAKVLIFSLRDSEKTGMLHIEAGTPSNTAVFKADVPESATSWAIDAAPSQTGPGDEPSHKPGLAVNWKALSVVTVLAAIFGGAAYLLGKEEPPKPKPYEREDEIRQLGMRRKNDAGTW